MNIFSSSLGRKFSRDQARIFEEAQNVTEYRYPKFSSGVFPSRDLSPTHKGRLITGSAWLHGRISLARSNYNFTHGRKTRLGKILLKRALLHKYENIFHRRQEENVTIRILRHLSPKNWCVALLRARYLVAIRSAVFFVRRYFFQIA